MSLFIVIQFVRKVSGVERVTISVVLIQNDDKIRARKSKPQSQDLFKGF